MPIISSGARRALSIATVLACTFSLSACDFVASYTKPKMSPEEAKAEGMALGAGCRQAGQTLETCYQNNDGSSKAGIFVGWKDMHEYMAAKNIATVYAPGTQPAPKTEAEADAAQSGSKDAAVKDASRDKDSKDGKDSKDAKTGKDKDSKDMKSGKDKDVKTTDSSSTRDPKPRDEKAHERADRARGDRTGDRARARDDSSDRSTPGNRIGRLADPASS